LLLEAMLMENVEKLGVKQDDFEEALVFHSKDGLKEYKIDKLFEKLDEDINSELPLKLGKKMHVVPKTQAAAPSGANGRMGPAPRTITQTTK